MSSGNLAFPLPLFTDEEVSGLTFSSHGELSWGSRKDQCLAVYHRDSEEFTVSNETPFQFREVLAVSPNGLSAIVLLQQ